MFERELVPSEPNAFSGSRVACGATRWMTPITIVPWPNAAYCALPSTMAIEDWSTIAMLDWFTTTGCHVGHGVGAQGTGGGAAKSVSSEPPGWFRVKSNPGRRTLFRAGWLGSTPVSMSATIPLPTNPSPWAPDTWTIAAAGWLA